MEVCPEGAIRETGRELGVLESGRRDGVAFVHGRLRVGEAMSPPLIKTVRASAHPNHLTIIDAPPGTSCPVIASMKGVDFVILVTEPTPFGLHDLKLAYEAVKILGIPCGLIINRSDLGDDKVWAYAEEKEIPILMEIPFDRGLAEAYSRGVPMVEAVPEWKKRFIDMFRRIHEILGIEYSQTET